MVKRIVLCADDYGQAPEISQGIINLIAQNRLSATSCIVNSPHWISAAKALLSYDDQIDIGLHFNLTEGMPLSAQFIKVYGNKLFSLPTLMRLAVLGQLDYEAILAEWFAQLDRFIDGLGFYPHFIDGHQHIHQFNIIRTALIEAYLKRLKHSDCYVRLVNPPLYFYDIFTNYKKWMIYLMGTKKLQQLLNKEKIPYNESFTGIYPFYKASEFPHFFSHFLKEIQNKGLIMCHPGLISDHKDQIASVRIEEYKYLAGDQFLHDCKKYSVYLGKFNPSVS